MSSDLVEEIRRIPVHPGAAMQCMTMVDDPNVSIRQVAAVIETDPALSMRVIALANTAYFAQREPAGSAARAVAVVGLATLRSVIATAILDLGTAEGISVPMGFWNHAVTTAAAAAAFAPRFGVDPRDAFSGALLHDVGRALVFRRASDVHAAIEAAVADGADAEAVELELLGVTHASIGGDALAQLGFSIEAVSAVRDHHDRDRAEQDPLVRTLALADIAAHAVDDTGTEEQLDAYAEACESVAIDADERQSLLERICLAADNLHSFAT